MSEPFDIAPENTPGRSMRKMMRLALLRQRTTEAYDAWAATYGLPSFETLQRLEIAREGDGR